MGITNLTVDVLSEAAAIHGRSHGHVIVDVEASLRPSHPGVPTPQARQFGLQVGEHQLSVLLAVYYIRLNIT